VKYLTFMLADLLCGIELSCARELLGYMPFALNAAEHPAVVGSFELRGRRVRVVDLRIRFGLSVTRTDDTVMIVVELAGETVAAIVDNVLGLEKPAALLPVDSNARSRFVLDVARALIIPPPMPKAA
jgi:chemotaxis signal transduction protein